MIDTLKIVEILEKEMEEPKARAVARAIDEAAKQSGENIVEQLERKLVTKDEFYAAMRDMQKQMGNLQVDMQKQMGNLQGDMQKQMGNLQGSLQKQMADLEARLLRWTFGFWVSAILAIVASRWIR